jgi:hypothetical protein
MPVEPIKITGLDEFRKLLRKLDRDLPKGLRLASNEAAAIVVDYAQKHVPRRTGRAARSIRASSTSRQARVTGGSARVAYYPWLDFGGRVGRKRSVRRPFVPAGRYIYPGLGENRDKIAEAMIDALARLASDAGLVMDE